MTVPDPEADEPEPEPDDPEIQALAEKLHAELDVLIAIRDHGVFWPGDD